ncbi:MAG: winged helix-turn-helix domain-containing protein [Terracidiphilus sp.]
MPATPSSTALNQSAKPVFRFGPFRYDSGQRLLFREDEMVPLAPKVAETLRVLLERHGTVVEKAELMREVWPDTTVEEIGLARNISQLRKALGDESETDKYIETLPKRGYRFVGDVVPEWPEDGSRVRAKAILSLIWRFRGFLLVAGALCVILGFVYWQFYRPSRYLSSGEHIASIAVVPFECLSPELDCGAFPHGLTDLLVARLSKLENVHVLSPSTVRSYQRARLSMPFMSRVLGMDLMLDGTIQRAGERVRVTARLVDVHSAKLVWSESYEYPVEQLGAAQSQAASEIAAQVGAHLEVHGRMLPAKP